MTGRTRPSSFFEAFKTCFAELFIHLDDEVPREISTRHSNVSGFLVGVLEFPQSRKLIFSVILFIIIVCQALALNLMMFSVLSWETEEHFQ